MRALQRVLIGGKERELLVAPSLFRVAKDRGWRIEIQDTEDIIEVTEAYLRLIYCSIINAYEVRKWDNPNLEEPDITLMELYEWSTEHPEDYGKLLNDFIELLTGKKITEIAKETEDIKKKKKSIWSKTMTKLKSFF